MTMLQHSVIESGGYNIDRSLRFRSSAGAYLSRTPAVASNRKTWTWSGWVKRGALADGVLITASNGTQYVYFAFSTNSLTLQINTGTNYIYTTTAVLRDPSAWYHIVLAVDTTQTLDANRVQIYVNGVAQARTAGGVPQNTDTQLNVSAVPSWIGSNGGVNTFFDGYLTEVNFIDGQALTPSSFGQTDAVTGVWTPKKYTGTYGTNGFYLDFKDNTSATTLAYDKSGNGNNWTPNNISTTAGATYDSMTDVPTLTSASAGNFATLNPLSSSTAAVLAPVDGNLSQTCNIANWQSRSATISVSSGKWYWEVLCSVAASYWMVGIDQATRNHTTVGQFPGDSTTSYGYFNSTGQKYNNATAAAYGSTYTTGDIVGVALDLDSGTLTFYKNGVSQGTAFSSLSGTFTPATGVYGGGGAFAANFGQRPFSYTPPTGFKALNTFNLPDPTIKKGSDYFNIALNTGANIKTSTEALFSGSQYLEWIKDRANANNHQLLDTVRGTTAVLQSNTTSAETTYSAPSGNSVGWAWKKGATQGFDIVTYTGNGTANRAIPHSLGVAPKFMIVKDRGTALDWNCWFTGFTADEYLKLNTTAAKGSYSTLWYQTPTSSNFYIGSTGTGVNYNSGNNYIAYLFAEIQGFSKFGSYTGNGSADGPFVYCGFRPKYVMVKSSSAVTSWYVLDSVRDTYNIMGNELVPNTSNPEAANQNDLDFTSNGFKWRVTAAAFNGNGSTYIYAAFAENPFKYSNAR